LSGVNLTGVNLAGLNLSGSNVRIKLVDGLNLKNTNLTGIDLSGQIITNQQIQGANLTGTHVKIVFPCPCDENTIFDETCSFMDYQGYLISNETLNKSGYRVQLTPEGYHLMKLGSQNFYVKEPKRGELRKIHQDLGYVKDFASFIESAFPLGLDEKEEQQKEAAEQGKGR
jgi:hypothetical protein